MKVSYTITQTTQFILVLICNALIFLLFYFMFIGLMQIIRRNYYGCIGWTGAKIVTGMSLSLKKPYYYSDFVSTLKIYSEP